MKYKYKYIQDIANSLSSMNGEVSPIAFYVDMESLRVKRKGGSRELAATILSSLVLAALGERQANHALWYIWFRDSGDTEIDKTVEVIKSITSMRRVAIRTIPFGDVMEATSEVVESLCSLLKKCKLQSGDPEIAGAIIAQFMENWAKDSRAISKLMEEKDE